MKDYIIEGIANASRIDGITPTLASVYFIPGEIDFIKTEKTYTHYRVKIPDSIATVLRDTNNASPQREQKDGYGPLQDGLILFKKCYRKKVCCTCGVEKPSDAFYWKKKGYEGPFSELWKHGRRQSSCMSCEAKVKHRAYGVRIKIEREEDRRHRASHRSVRVLDPRKMKISEHETSEIPKDAELRLKSLLSNFAMEMILEAK